VAGEFGDAKYDESDGKKYKHYECYQARENVEDEQKADSDFGKRSAKHEMFIGKVKTEILHEIKRVFFEKYKSVEWIEKFFLYGHGYKTEAGRDPEDGLTVLADLGGDCLEIGTNSV